MPWKRLVWALLPGLLPLILYSIASELWGEFVGLGVGVGLGVLEFAVLAFQRQFDPFVLIDTGLLVVLGALSLGANDGVFFRLKPVLIEVILVGFLAASAWGPRNLLLSLTFKGESGRSIREALENHPASKRMRSTLAIVTVLFAAHTVLSLVSALWMSEEAWAFITGVLPFVLIAIVALVPWLGRLRPRS